MEETNPLWSLIRKVHHWKSFHLGNSTPKKNLSVDQEKQWHCQRHHHLRHIHPVLLGNGTAERGRFPLRARKCRRKGSASPKITFMQGSVISLKSKVSGSFPLFPSWNFWCNEVSWNLPAAMCKACALLRAGNVCSWCFQSRTLGFKVALTGTPGVSCVPCIVNMCEYLRISCTCSFHPNPKVEVAPFVASLAGPRTRRHLKGWKPWPQNNEPSPTTSLSI